jgi:hypothetical protein
MRAPQNEKLTAFDDGTSTRGTQRASCTRKSDSRDTASLRRIEWSSRISQAQPHKDYRLIAGFSRGFIARHGGKHRAFGADKWRGGLVGWADADLISGGGTPVWA